jgi:hypothetical protein
MCRTRAFAATAALLAFALAGEAHAWPFGKKDKPVAEADAKPKQGGFTNLPEPDAPVAATPATPAERAAAMRQSPLAQAAFWTREFELNGADAEAGVRLAAALRAMGQNAEAAETAERVLIVKPDHVEALTSSPGRASPSARASTRSRPLKRVQQLQPETTGVRCR